MIVKKLLMFTAIITGFSFITVDGNCNDNLRRTKSFTQYTNRPHIDPEQKIQKSKSMSNLHNSYNINDDSEDDGLSFLYDTYSIKEANKDNSSKNNVNYKNNTSPIKNFIGKKRYRDNSNYYLPRDYNEIIDPEDDKYWREEMGDEHYTITDYGNDPSDDLNCYYYPEDFDN